MCLLQLFQKVCICRYATKLFVCFHHYSARSVFVIRHKAVCVPPSLRCKVCLCNPTQSSLCFHHYAAGSVFVIRHRALCVSLSLRCKVCLCNPTQSSFCVSIITLQGLSLQYGTELPMCFHHYVCKVCLCKSNSEPPVCFHCYKRSVFAGPPRSFSCVSTDHCNNTPEIRSPR